MLAILITLGTKYACNLDLFFKSFLTQDDHFQSVLKIFEIAGIYGPQQIRLQAYMVPILTEIAGIFGPQRDQGCTQIWSLLQPKLQA